ncbi:TonB-dependent heme/hemoglobin receptor family protein [Methylocella silvestris BL2]|uniref:TonB-dependent heme/hemoglobin receptor family protein n=1 Tax=Methylocella silvestris (strain DSM 15510 / CIP 108128 / LMG 27833 / NCIMB 13906 / BL2) TaxID=395965 RepID=B8ENU4_METSB|nr:TonB-dependent hemoglobin/transferrin/lactoferrin family receptor [Methylocella silvestris]ACK50880.1 TonB-dependent heme/hemoglobin receptor family protein [Methylocella silvestris BL2]
MSVRAGAATAAVATFFAIAPVYGQTAPAPSQDAVPAADAAAPNAGLSGAISLDQITVTSTKTPEQAIDALSASSVVDTSQINILQPSKASGVLQDIPGVTTQESQNDPGQSVNIRGLQDFGRVNILVDGARQDFQISGHNANGTYYLDPAFIGRADVTRGPVSNIYGSGAIGGVVSYTTRGVEDVLDPGKIYGASQTTGLGSNSREILTSTAGAARFGDYADLYAQFVYRGLASYFDGVDEKVADTGSTLAGGLFKANLRPAEGQQITVSTLNQSYNFTNNGTSNAGSRFSDHVTTGNYTLGYTAARPDLPWLDFSAKAYYTTTKNQQTALAPDETYEALGVVPGDPLADSMSTIGFDIHNTSRFDTGPLSHELTYGGDSAWDHVNTFDNAGGFISALTPSGNRRLSGGFVQDQLRYGGWLRFVGALRYDDYSLTGDGVNSGGGHLSPKITISVTPVQGIELYGLYAEAYRAPSVTETFIEGVHPFPAFNILPNPDLTPETGHNFEGGVNIKYDNILAQGDKLRIKANVFSNTVDNYIDFEPVGPSFLVPFIPGAPTSLCNVAPFLCFPITSFQYVNIAQAHLYGVELEGGYDWGGGFVTISGAHINARNVSANQPLITSIPDKISGTFGLRFLDQQLTIGARAVFVASSVKLYDDTGATTNEPTKGYGLLDLFASYKFSESVNADLYLKNVFNQQYTQYLNTLPSAGFGAKASLTVKFSSM